MLTESINQASLLIDSLTNILPKIVGFSSVAAAFLPAPADTSYLSKLHKAINIIAFNFNHAQNKS